MATKSRGLERNWMRLQRDSNVEEMPTVEMSLAALERSAESPSLQSLISILQKCRKQKNLGYAKRLHVHICNNGLENHSTLGNYLVSLFVECGSMLDAQQVFDRLVHRNEYSWNSLIQGYVECGESQNALSLVQKMREDCVSPSKHTFASLLKACSRLRCTERGQEIHAEVIKQGFERDPFVGTNLLVMYAKCGLLAEAQEAFDELTIRDVVSWTALISGYAEHVLAEQALNCFESMQLEGVSPNAVTFVCSLKLCGIIGAIDKGRAIHICIARDGFERDPIVGSTLVDMYVKGGSLPEAQDVFDKLLVQDVVSWTTLIAGYAEHGLGEEGLNCLTWMQLDGVHPNAITFVCSLKACVSIGVIDKVREIHVEVTKGKHEIDAFVGSTLVDIYVRYGSLAEAQEVFDKLPVQGVVSWNTLIAGYVEQGLGEEGFNHFQRLQLNGVSPDVITFVCSLKACGNTGAIDYGQDVHSKIVKEGLEMDPFICSTLVDMYAKCGSLVETQEVFEKLPVPDVVAWNTLIAGYTEHGLGEKALNFLEQMQQEGLSPDAVTFSTSLKACGSTGARGRGQEIHAEIVKQSFEQDPSLGSTLVDMYAKWGLLTEAWDVFEKLLVQNVVAWTALMAGYAYQGESELVFYLFERMRDRSIQPDGTTFLSILTVCSHSGLVDKGQMYFEAMSKEYGISPTIEQYNCMVDLLCRAGQLDKAMSMLEKISFQPDIVTWSTILSACRKWRNVELGRQAFECAVRLDGKYTAAFILMSNIYVDAHMLEDAKKIDARRVNTHS